MADRSSVEEPRGQTPAPNANLSGVRVVVTAGGTRESLDPVRVLTNRSSGKMGLAFAAAAARRGADVTLVSTVGRGDLSVRLVEVDSVQSLRSALLDLAPSTEMLIMAAAVSDFRVVSPSTQKVKKRERLWIELEAIPDFMKELPGTIFKVGFAAETSDIVEAARAKFLSHGFDVVCANDVSRSDAGFEVDTNEITLLFPDGDAHQIPLMPKTEAAEKVLDLVTPRLLDRRTGQP